MILVLTGCFDPLLLKLLFGSLALSFEVSIFEPWVINMGFLSFQYAQLLGKVPQSIAFTIQPQQLSCIQPLAMPQSSTISLDSWGFFSWSHIPTMLNVTFIAPVDSASH